MIMSRPVSEDRQSPPLRSTAIHESADKMVRLIESEIQAHTAAAETQLADFRAMLAATRQREASLAADLAAAQAKQNALRAQLQSANQNVERLVKVLVSFGVPCRKDGKVTGAYGEELRWLLETLDADDESSEVNESVRTEELGELDPSRDLARVRSLLGRQTDHERWKEIFWAIQKEHDQKDSEARIPS